MLAFVCAMKREADAVLRHIQPQAMQKTTKCKKELYVGKVCGRDAAVIICGIGKVNAALATQFLLDNYAVSAVVNFGVCGAKIGRAELKKVYLATSAAQFDFDLTPINGGKIGQLEEFSEPFLHAESASAERLKRLLPEASLVSGDKFDPLEQTAEFIEKHFAAALRDMEGAAVAQVCAFADVPWVLVKGVSDYVGASSTQMFLENSNAALDVMSSLLPEIIKNL